jgi:excinuclease ABC subunit B
MYADRETEAMNNAIGETYRRREIQEAYNREHGITPETIRKNIFSIEAAVESADYLSAPRLEKGAALADGLSPAERIEALRSEMLLAAEALEFERAASLRDEIAKLEGNSPKTRSEPARSTRPMRQKRASRR